MDPFELSPEEQRAALVAALRGQQQPQAADFMRGWGNLGMQSGDRVLSGFGQSQVQQAGQIGAHNQQARQFGLGQLLQAQRQEQEQKLQARREAIHRAQQLADVQSSRTYQEQRDERQNAEALKRAGVMAGQKVAEQRRQATVPGMEIDQNAEPTQDDAKKLKTSLAAAARMGNYVKELRDLHSKHGTEYGGPVGTRMGQLSTAIKLEGKNIGELGAISGPDLGLIEQLAGADPSSLGANAKALVGVDNTQTALNGLEKWVGDTVAGNAQALGYHKKGAAGPGGDFSLGGQGETPAGQKWQVNRKTGERRLVPAK